MLQEEQRLLEWWAWRCYGRKIEREEWELEVGTGCRMTGRTAPSEVAGG